MLIWLFVGKALDLLDLMALFFAFASRQTSFGVHLVALFSHSQAKQTLWFESFDGSIRASIF